MWLVSLLDSIGSGMGKQISKTLRIGTFRFDGRNIMRDRGRLMRDELAIADVAQWEVFPEMGFDVVRITMKDNRCIQWTDTHADLMEILAQHAGTQKVQ